MERTLSSLISLEMERAKQIVLTIEINSSAILDLRWKKILVWRNHV